MSNDCDHLDIISEIFKGYTEFSFQGNSVFLRHISLFDQQNLQRLVDSEINRCVAKGIDREEDKLRMLKKESSWTDEDDIKISESRGYIANLIQTKKKLLLLSAQKETQKVIDEENAKLDELLAKRQGLVGQTAEFFGTHRANEKFLQSLLYSDNELTKYYFNDKQFGELEEDELSAIYGEYQKVMIRLQDEKIQEAVLQDCFNMYIGFSGSSQEMYGKPITKLTLFQLKILVYGKMFLNIFQNVENIPDSIRKDPKALLDFADSSKNREKKRSAANHKDGSTGFVVGTREDIEAYEPDAHIGNLSAELKKNGNFMSQDQILKSMNIL